jgi:hypothetical protein
MNLSILNLNSNFKICEKYMYVTTMQYLSYKQNLICYPEFQVLN